MAGPSGAFLPWIEHQILDGRCVCCGLVPKACCQDNPAVAYTHYDMTLIVKPTGNIIPCQPKETV